MILYGIKQRPKEGIVPEKLGDGHRIYNGDIGRVAKRRGENELLWVDFDDRNGGICLTTSYPNWSWPTP